jgi:hypothetical protein
VADQDPAIRTFQFDSGGFTGAIKKSVNLYRGSVNFPLPILQLPGRNGIGAAVTAIYTGISPEQATLWNRDAPVGVLGLGWNLPIEQITVQFRPGAAAKGGAEYFLHCGGQVYLLLASGPGEFVTQEYNFWRIRYDSGSETWTIIHEDGGTWSYGGDGPAGRYVDYGVHWQEWRDASTQTGSTQIPVAWKLRRIQSMWNDAITFSYRFQDKFIGATGITYTQASYLTGIKDCFDRTLTFHYAPKRYDDQVQEYMLRHAPHGDNWAYQDALGTEFLTGISVDAPEGPLFTVALESSLHDFSGVGSVTVSMTATGGDHESRPPNLYVDWFVYCVETKDDPFPIGGIAGFAGLKAPSDHWIICEGLSLPVMDTFQQVLSVIGACNGGDGATVFYVPDLRGRFLRGRDRGAQRDPDAGGRAQPLKTSGASGDAVGSVQEYATAKPLNSSGVTADVPHLPVDDHYNIASASTAHNICKWVGDPATPKVSGGDKESRPVNANCTFYIRFQ